jgi:hypothetical protein
VHRAPLHLRARSCPCNNVGGDIPYVIALGAAEFIDAAELIGPVILALYDAVYRPHLPVRYDVINDYLGDLAVLRNALDSLLERVIGSNRSLTDNVPMNVVRDTV